MAGIGFELRKIFNKRTLVSNIIGSVYATMSTVGPTIIFMLLLFTLIKVVNVLNTSEMDILFFISSFTYEFLIAIMVASVFNNVISRYISDKIFIEKEDDICASLFGLMTATSVLSGIIYFILCYLIYKNGNVSIYLLTSYYLLGVLVTNVYVVMNYVSALKEYKEVTYSFVIGFVPAAVVFFISHFLLNISLLTSIYASLALAFAITLLMLVFWCVKAFGAPSDNYFEFLEYFKKHFMLVISGICYTFGLYFTNIMYWNFSDMQVKVNIFTIAPNYDLATFFAMVISLPAFVLFVVNVETVFYEKYIKYVSALNEGTYDLIEKNRISMSNTVKLQLFFVYDMQLVISILLISISAIVFPLLSISNHVLSMFMILGMGMFCVTCMYLTVIFLYYFQDYKASAISTLVFLILEIISCLICLKLKDPYYPLPILISGIISWIVSFILLRRRLKNINSFILCK